MVTTKNSFRINGERLLVDIHALAAFGKQEPGINRSTFSPAYQQAVSWLISHMQEAGLETRIDAVGNVIGRMGPEQGAIVMTGSHIDTVRNGGPLDGSLGVLAGIEVARVISEKHIALTSPFEVVAFVDEEGVYLSMMGSMAMTGELTQQHLELSKDATGKSLIETMQSCGINASSYLSAAYQPGAISKFVELHIEQGPVLENLGLEIGVVDGIVCQRNVDYSFTGLSSHAGTTPMNMRQDAFRAATEFVTEAYALLDDPANVNPSTRITFGTCKLKPDFSNVIPCECTVRMDNRDLQDANSDRLAAKVAEVARGVAVRHKVSLVIDEKPFTPAAPMTISLIDSIKTATIELGYNQKIMSSGAGHDAQLMALVCDAGMIFVPSIRGLSHHPDEWTKPEHLEKGCNVLLQVLLLEMSELQ